MLKLSPIHQQDVEKSFTNQYCEAMLVTNTIAQILTQQVCFVQYQARKFDGVWPSNIVEQSYLSTPWHRKDRYTYFGIRRGSFTMFLCFQYQNLLKHQFQQKLFQIFSRSHFTYKIKSKSAFQYLQLFSWPTSYSKLLSAWLMVTMSLTRLVSSTQSTYLKECFIKVQEISQEPFHLYQCDHVCVMMKHYYQFQKQIKQKIEKNN